MAHGTFNGRPWGNSLGSLVYFVVKEYVKQFKIKYGHWPSEKDFFSVFHRGMTNHSVAIPKTNGMIIDKDNYDRFKSIDPTACMVTNFNPAWNFFLFDGATDKEYYLSNQWGNSYCEVDQIADYARKNFHCSITINYDRAYNRGSNLPLVSSKVPNDIPGYPDPEWNVFYADDVPDDEKIPGLIGFLISEYDNIASAYDRFDGKTVFDSEHEECWRKYHREWIPVILSNKMPTKSYGLSDSDLVKRIQDTVYKSGTTDSAKTLESIKVILKNGTFVDRIIGKYYHDGCPVDFSYNRSHDNRPYIVLYYRNLYCPNVDEYKTRMGNCLAHELFHFFHDCYAPATFNARNVGFERSAVVESLADFFSVMYILSQSKASFNPAPIYAQGRFELWRERFGSAWPYAYAYCFNCIHTNDISDLRESCTAREKFNAVLRKSRIDMYDAFDLL